MSILSSAKLLMWTMVVRNNSAVSKRLRGLVGFALITHLHVWRANRAATACTYPPCLLLGLQPRATCNSETTAVAMLLQASRVDQSVDAACRRSVRRNETMNSGRYNLAVDKNETTNLAGSPEHASLLAMLKQRLVDAGATGPPLASAFVVRSQN